MALRPIALSGKPASLTQSFKEEIEDEFAVLPAGATGWLETSDVAPANIDGAVAVPSMRTLLTEMSIDNLHAPTAQAILKHLRPSKVPSGSFIMPPYLGNKSTATLGTKETLILYPVDIWEAVTTSGIAVNVTAVGTGTGQQMRLGVYADDGTGTKPTGAPLWDAGATSTLSEGVRIIEAEKTWEPKRYWLGMVLQGALSVNPTFTTVTYTVNQTIGTPSFTESNSGLKMASAGAGALPTIGTLVPSNLATILIGLKVK